MYWVSPTEDWSGLQEKQHTPVLLQMYLHQGEMYKQDGGIYLAESYEEERSIGRTTDWLIDWWSFTHYIDSTILHSWAESLHFCHVIFNESNDHLFLFKVHFDNPLKWCTYTVTVLFGYYMASQCHMKVLLSQQVLCTSYNHAPCHFMQRPKPHMFGACVFSCNLPPALLAEWQGSFTCYCRTKKTAELVKLWKWRGSAKGTTLFWFL